MRSIGYLTTANLPPTLLDQILRDRAPGVIDGPDLEFREVLDGVTAVPEHCVIRAKGKEPIVNVALFLQWFCPTLNEDEAWRLSKLPSARSIKIEEAALKAFIKLHAYKEHLS